MKSIISPNFIPVLYNPIHHILGSKLSSIWGEPHRDQPISELAKKNGYRLSENEQLYLHIVPIWRQWARKDPYTFLSTDSEKRGDVVSIPIQWK